MEWKQQSGPSTRFAPSRRHNQWSIIDIVVLEILWLRLFAPRIQQTQQYFESITPITVMEDMYDYYINWIEEAIITVKEVVNELTHQRNVDFHEYYSLFWHYKRKRKW
ncbi:hypothetical protein RIR_jg39686.t1 [Rhizophagus irregularis DAOM 181602=DAOM 197198]|nr:hypothetical protein RIR_jg39686.t1 [Rhizophagus irregularis DAOM 181602=DAOM 197198]